MNRSIARDVRPGFSRRSILSGLTLGLGTAVLAPRFSLRRALAAPPTDPTFVVLVNLSGGNDSLNMFVPHGLSAYYTQRPNIAIPSGDLLPITAGEGLHPALAPIHPLYAAGDLAIVRQVGYPDPNLSHFESADIWSKGVRDLQGTTDPRGWIGRAADLYFPGALDVVGVGVGRSSDFVANTAKPLVVEGLGSYGPGQNAVPWWERDQRDAAAKAMLAAGSAVETSPAKDLRKGLVNAYDLVDVIKAAEDGYTSPVTYPDEYFASRLQDVARLIKAGLGGRVFYTGLGGFDTHSDQPAQHTDILSRLAQALDAFQKDLVAMGKWDKAAIVVMSEFGRRVYDNSSFGTDHGHGQSILALGGALQGGVFGPAHTNAHLTDNEDVPGTIDFRAIYANILERHLDVGAGSGVFPEAWTGDQRVALFS